VTAKFAACIAKWMRKRKTTLGMIIMSVIAEGGLHG
jgi:hypothetical protein